MDEKKIIDAILDLEEVVDKAEELQAIALLQYDSFVEGRCFAEDSSVYKTTTSIIKREAREVYEMLQEKFNQLYSLIKVEKPFGMVQERGDFNERSIVIHRTGSGKAAAMQSQTGV